MYKLYFSPGACSMAVHVVLNELNLPIELKNIWLDNRKTKDPHFLEINPRGQVPTLIHNDFVIREGVAILQYLLDNTPNTLLPKSGKERILALEWLMFANATLHPAYARIFFLIRNKKEHEADELLDIAHRNLYNLWKEVEQTLNQHPFLCGNQPTIADILITVIANWTIPMPVHFGLNTKKLLKNITNLPSYKKALEVEGIEYKAVS